MVLLLCDYDIGKSRELFSYNNFLFLYVAYFQLIEHLTASTE